MRTLILTTTFPKSLANIKQSKVKITDNLKVIESFKPNQILLIEYFKLLPKKYYEHYNTINFHQSLLPKYAGKGMFGKNLLKKIIKNKEKYAGITLHKVTGDFDEGPIIKKYKINMQKITDIKLLKQKIMRLEKKALRELI